VLPWISNALTDSPFDEDREVRRHAYRAEIGERLADQSIDMGVTDGVGEAGPQRGDELVDLGDHRLVHRARRVGYSRRGGHGRGKDIARHGLTIALGDRLTPWPIARHGALLGMSPSAVHLLFTLRVRSP